MNLQILKEFHEPGVDGQVVKFVDIPGKNPA